MKRAILIFAAVWLLSAIPAAAQDATFGQFSKWRNMVQITTLTTEVDTVVFNDGKVSSANRQYYAGKVDEFVIMHQSFADDTLLLFLWCNGDTARTTMKFFHESTAHSLQAFAFRVRADSLRISNGVAGARTDVIIKR